MLFCFIFPQIPFPLRACVVAPPWSSSQCLPIFGSGKFQWRSYFPIHSRHNDREYRVVMPPDNGRRNWPSPSHWLNANSILFRDCMTHLINPSCNHQILLITWSPNHVIIRSRDLELTSRMSITLPRHNVIYVIFAPINLFYDWAIVPYKYALYSGHNRPNEAIADWLKAINHRLRLDDLSRVIDRDWFTL